MVHAGRLTGALLVPVTLLVLVVLACSPAATPTPTPTSTPPAGTTPTTIATPTPTSGPQGAPPRPMNPVDTITIAEITVGVAQGYPTFGAATAMVNMGIGENFFMWDENSYEVGMLAESWQLAPDLSGGTIRVRSGVQFHKGYGELTAQDMAWVYNTSNPPSIQ